MKGYYVCETLFQSGRYSLEAVFVQSVGVKDYNHVTSTKGVMTPHTPAPVLNQQCKPEGLCRSSFEPTWSTTLDPIWSGSAFLIGLGYWSAHPVHVIVCMEMYFSRSVSKDMDKSSQKLLECIAAGQSLTQSWKVLDTIPLVLTCRHPWASWHLTPLCSSVSTNTHTFFKHLN